MARSRPVEGEFIVMDTLLWVACEGQPEAAKKTKFERPGRWIRRSRLGRRGAQESGYGRQLSARRPEEPAGIRGGDGEFRLEYASPDSP